MAFPCCEGKWQLPLAPSSCCSGLWVAWALPGLCQGQQSRSGRLPRARQPCFAACPLWDLAWPRLGAVPALSPCPEAGAGTAAHAGARVPLCPPEASLGAAVPVGPGSPGCLPGARLLFLGTLRLFLPTHGFHSIVPAGRDLRSAPASESFLVCFPLAFWCLWP